MPPKIKLGIRREFLTDFDCRFSCQALLRQSTSTCVFFSLRVVLLCSLIASLGSMPVWISSPPPSLPFPPSPPLPPSLLSHTYVPLNRGLASTHPLRYLRATIVELHWETSKTGSRRLLPPYNSHRASRGGNGEQVKGGPALVA